MQATFRIARIYFLNFVVETGFHFQTKHQTPNLTCTFSPNHWPTTNHLCPITPPATAIAVSCSSLPSRATHLSVRPSCFEQIAHQYFFQKNYSLSFTSPPNKQNYGERQFWWRFKKRGSHKQAIPNIWWDVWHQKTTLAIGTQSITI